jgi:hypothetical protein
MADWLRHLLGRPCRQRVTGHGFTPSDPRYWGTGRLCTWLAHPQANRCLMPGRCHDQRPP